MNDHVTVRVDDQELRLSNLDKAMYPGFTKRDVILYYQRVAPAILPRLRHRPATMVRFPDGVTGGSFFEKDVSRHAPEWVPTARLVSGARGGGSAINHHVVIGELSTLVWTANLAALELHVPQWTISSDGGRNTPDLLVFDLDPGEPATIVECCRTAEWLRDALVTDGLRPYPKTSGSKGLQLYCPVRTHSVDRTSGYAKDIARRLEAEHSGEVLATMAKSARRGKVFIDWSQNNQAKTTVAAYSLRARQRPTVSTPVTWGEVRDCRRPEDLVFTSSAVLRRLDEIGDLLADLDTNPCRL
jgi:bifunctional non-homologous end joining protein LigD